jgi:Fe-S-cluster containining protein
MSAGDHRPRRSEFAAALARRGPLPVGADRGGGEAPPGPESAHATPWGPPPPFVPPSTETLAAVAEVYASVERALAPAAAACRACGRCCRFRPGDIVLFAGSLEMAALVAEAGPPDAADVVPGGAVAGRWTCPYQEGDRCTVRAVRPLGCRTYFCEAGAEAEGRAVHAGALARLRAVTREHGYPWWYGPANVYLDGVVSVR